jgi:hypothetical protein
MSAELQRYNETSARVQPQCARARPNTSCSSADFPAVSVFQTNSASPRRYPAYHTSIDGFDYVKRYIDPTFSSHVSITKLVAEVVLQLASSSRLPLDVRELADVLETEYDSLLQESMEEFKYTLGGWSKFRCLEFVFVELVASVLQS